MIQQIYNKFLDYSWALLVLLLPITSMPIIVRVVGSNTVGALSGIFLLILLILWFVPNILKWRKNIQTICSTFYVHNCSNNFHIDSVIFSYSTFQGIQFSKQ